MAELAVSIPRRILDYSFVFLTTNSPFGVINVPFRGGRRIRIPSHAPHAKRLSAKFTSVPPKSRMTWMKMR